MKHRLRLNWEEEEFKNRMRFVCRFTDDIIFTYYWDEFHEHYRTNVWLKTDNDYANLSQTDFKSVTKHFEEWFISNLNRYLKVFHNVNNYIVDNISMAVVFDKQGFVLENPDRPYKLREPNVHHG